MLGVTLDLRLSYLTLAEPMNYSHIMCCPYKTILLIPLVF